MIVSQTIQTPPLRQNRAWELTKEAAFTSIPFLALYKPFSYPVALGAGALRIGASSIQLLAALQEGDRNKIFNETVATTIAVISLAGTFFAHPIGMLISTGYDLILEFRHLAQHIRDGKHQDALQSCLKILGHSLYFAVFAYGGPEIAICFLAVQLTIGVLEARHEFTQGHYISALGHALMATIRGSQLTTQVKTLQLKWELQDLLKKIASDPNPTDYVGKLAEKWQFPSDHLPVGAKVGNANIITWNVLNNHFMSWVTELDSQGLNGSLISKLHDQKSLKYPGLTLRDELIASQLLHIISNNDNLILALQECSPEFTRALDQMLPSHMDMLLSDKPGASIDYNIVAYNKNTFTLTNSSIDKPFTLSDPKRTTLTLNLQEKSTQQNYQVICAHIPGDPNKPGTTEFAHHVLSHLKPDHHTIALGDMNFTHDEMQAAFNQVAPNSLRNLASYNTNINPVTFTAKAIDHIWVNTDLPCTTFSPNQILPNLQSTVDLLHPHRTYLLQAQRLEELQKHYRKQQLHESILLAQHSRV